MTRTRAGAYDEQLVRVRGCDVRVRVTGDGPPLLLLNGLARPLESWDDVTAALTGRTVVTLDAPGVGGSATPISPLPITALAALAADVLDEVGLTSADVLGFSHGGAVAQQLALDHPARVCSLVLAATSCGAGATAGSPGARVLQRPSGARGWPRSDTVGTLWNAVAVSQWSSIPFLGALTAPTLVVCGERDRVTPPANSRLLARRIPGARLVLLAAGHDLQRPGAARLLTDAVEEFLPARTAGTRS